MKIEIIDSVSLSDLVVAHKHGHSVIQMPHCGNATLSKVVLAGLGFKSIFYPWTKGVLDKKNQPHGIRCAGVFREMVSSEVFASHAITSDGTPIAQLHVDTFKSVTGAVGGEVLRYEEYLNKNQSLVLEILRAIFVCRRDIDTSNASVWWSRKTDSNGLESHGSVESFDQLLEAGIVGVNSSKGFIIPLVQTLLLTTAIEAVNSRHESVFHLGGKVSVSYFLDEQETLSLFFSAIKDILSLTRLNLLVPNVSGVFSAPEKLEKQLNDLYQANDRFNKNNQAKSDLRKVLAPIRHIFWDLGYTQHDMRLSGQGVCIPSWLVDQKLSDLIQMKKGIINLIPDLEAKKHAHLPGPVW